LYEYDYLIGAKQQLKMHIIYDDNVVC